MGSSVAEMVNRQVRSWSIAQEARLRDGAPSAVPEPAHVITISRTLGSFGPEIARRVAADLGVPIYDREMLDHIAGTAHVRVQTVVTLDERTQGRLDDFLAALFRERNFDESDYFRGLTRTIAALWAHGSCVILGRGASFIIDGAYNLRVRVDAPVEIRIERFGRDARVGASEARRLVLRSDAERAAFGRHCFDCDVTDPLNYDLCLNTGAIDSEAGAAALLAAFRTKFRQASARGDTARGQATRGGRGALVSDERSARVEP